MHTPRAIVDERAQLRKHLQCIKHTAASTAIITACVRYAQERHNSSFQVLRMGFPVESIRLDPRALAHAQVLFMRPAAAGGRGMTQGRDTTRAGRLVRACARAIYSKRALFGLEVGTGPTTRAHRRALARLLHNKRS